MAEGSRLNFTQVNSKVSDHDHIIMTLLQRIESLEQERQRNSGLEQTVVTLSQRVDALEHECQQFRALAMPQQSNSGSNNQLNAEPQLENPEETQGYQGMVPMEIEDNEPVSFCLVNLSKYTTASLLECIRWFLVFFMLEQ
jgi:hypothetical protein